VYPPIPFCIFQFLLCVWLLPSFLLFCKSQFFAPTGSPSAVAPITDNTTKATVISTSLIFFHLLQPLILVSIVRGNIRIASAYGIFLTLLPIPLINKALSPQLVTYKELAYIYIAIS
jgi:hypothetical protein